MLPNLLLSEFENVCKQLKIADKDKLNALKKVEAAYEDAQISPGEAIGIITAESFGEPSTQMSVSYFEKVIVKIDEKIKIVKIGEFIDSLMNKFGKLKSGVTEILPLSAVDVYVPSINADEKIEWKRVLEVSRHKSPNKLIRINTASGRKITATDNHSFVTRINNLVVPVLGKVLRIGDRIPSIRYLPEHCIESIDVTNYVEFPDLTSFRVTREYRPTKLIPSKLDLDWSFGWFIGAYLSEGGYASGSLSIYNLDNNYINNARRFVNSIELNYVEKEHSRGFSNSRDFIINSSLLARFIGKVCGKGSSNKFVPEFAYSAKEEFVSGLLRGYFDGDGNFSVSRRMMRVSSNSEELLDGIKLLLTRFGIFASKSKDKKQSYLIIPYKYSRVFLDKIGSDISYKLDNLNKLVLLANKTLHLNYRDHTDMIGGFGDLLVNISKKLGLHTRYVNSATKRQKIGRTALLRHIRRFEEVSIQNNVDINLELGLLKQMYESDVVWDEIAAVEYVDKNHDNVYDFSVSGLETFTTFDGIITHNTLNTFHFAGVAEMDITVGLPRLIEVFDARKIPSTPKMELTLKQKYCRTSELVREVAMRVKETRLGDIVSEFSINIPKLRVEVNLSRKALRDLGLKPSDVVEVVKQKMKTFDVVDDRGNMTISFKSKEIELSEVYKLKEKLKDIHVFGLKGVTQVLPVKNDDGNYIIHCAGSNLKDALHMEEIDPVNVMTNNIFEIADILGIEAARAAIIKEAEKVIKEQGLEINIRHIMLLADVMTRTGVIKGVTRSGITGEKESVLARASFETPMKHIINAALTGEVDELNSVVENVMLNQPVPLGTGLPKLVVKGKDETKK